MQRAKYLKLKILILSSLFLPPSAFSTVAYNTVEGLGVESVMGGVGLARLGSNGALGSNPALLAWLPKQHEFISSNSINYYKLASQPGGDINVVPDVVPRLAASTEGFGNWGHSYGLIINKMKVTVDQTTDGTRALGTSETQVINLNYGFGSKVSDHFSLGFSLNLGRFQEDGQFSSVGESGGFEFAYGVQNKKSFFYQGLSLGFAGEFDNWSAGAVAKFNTIVFGATSFNEFTGYSEVTNSNTTETDHQKEPIKVIPIYGLGVQRKFDHLRSFFDLNYTQGHTDVDTNDYVKSNLSGALGLDGALTEAYRWYSGLAYSLSNIGGEGEAGTASFGLSKRGPHSLNFAGLSWTRALRASESELIALNFGTKFDY